VMAFSKSSKKFAIVVNLTVNQIKLYQVTENEWNKLISTLNWWWSWESFTVIKSKLN
jgi:hypothetical protein